MDVLLSHPNASSEEFGKLVKRKGCKYENRSERFVVAEREYTRQYSHLYFTRLTRLKTRLTAAARKLWGE